MQNKFNLRSVLPAMGISDAFNPTAADFTGISGQFAHSHYLIQKLFMNVSVPVIAAAQLANLIKKKMYFLQWRRVFMCLMPSMK